MSNVSNVIQAAFGAERDWAAMEANTRESFRQCWSAIGLPAELADEKAAIFIGICRDMIEKMPAVQVSMQAFQTQEEFVEQIQNVCRQCVKAALLHSTNTLLRWHVHLAAPGSTREVWANR